MCLNVRKFAWICVLCVWWLSYGSVIVVIMVYASLSFVCVTVLRSFTKVEVLGYVFSMSVCIRLCASVWGDLVLPPSVMSDCDTAATCTCFHYTLLPACEARDSPMARYWGYCNIYIYICDCVRVCVRNTNVTALLYNCDILSGPFVIAARFSYPGLPLYSRSTICTLADGCWGLIFHL